MSASALRIAVTPGEPAGIGPDLCVQLAGRDCSAELVLIGDATLLQQRAALLSLPGIEARYDASRPAQAGHICIDDLPLQTLAQCGHLDARNARYVLNTLDRAIAGCLCGEFDALVTGPIHKGVINDAGIAFTGHTEYLAEHSGAPQPVMLLTAGSLRVALATTHLPLRAVSTTITRPLLSAVLRILHQDLQRLYGIDRPRLLVCGLNPHAGEGGHLGREEIEIIAPVLEVLRSEGLDLFGPLPADTIFTPRFLDKADAIVAMYHDQGLPVLKHVGFGRAVNVTLGLPLIRTSVDHGTGLDLAGTGAADAGSLLVAVDTAVELAGHRSRWTGTAP